MRHLGSLVLSLVLAPAIGALAGFGLGAYGRARESVGAEDPPQLVFALAALAAAGVLFALLIMPRLSPVGPALVGLAVLGVVGWLTFDAAALQRALPRSVHAVLGSPAAGYAVPLAIPLVATVFSSRRWRRWEGAPALYAAIPDPDDDPRRFDGLSQFDGLGASTGTGGFDEPDDPNATRRW